MSVAKLPVLVPSLVTLSDIVGVSLLLQHNPLVVISATPSEVMFPPALAGFSEMSVKASIDTI